ncbi:MAG TPA: type II toxin-antitoxin system VapC family toxin [Gemmatimonadaceae bacterium]|nr:type II toxin-antitoxin system VapC family toxin [Gemmatimonadaceae bacterium]
MKVIDLNLLLYAVNRDSPRHSAAMRWLQDAMSGEERIGLAWTVLLGFIRVTTSPRVFEHPLSVDDALRTVDAWLSQASVAALEPGEGHWSILRDLLLDAGSAGNLTTDAHLAALAIEHGAELCSTDADFARFERLRWTNPLS